MSNDYKIQQLFEYDNLFGGIFRNKQLNWNCEINK